MDINSLVFFILALVILFFSFKTVTSSNPIYCALYLAITMVNLAFMFLSMGAPFIAGVQLVVYAGAIMVLFVMVLMLFDLKKELRAFSRGRVSGFFKMATAGLICGFLSFIFLISTELVFIGDSQRIFTEAPTSTMLLAQLLFTRYLLAFEVLGVLLLLIAVGAVAISRIKGGTHAGAK